MSLGKFDDKIPRGPSDRENLYLPKQNFGNDPKNEGKLRGMDTPNFWDLGGCASAAFVCLAKRHRRLSSSSSSVAAAAAAAAAL